MASPHPEASPPDSGFDPSINLRENVFKVHLFVEGGVARKTNGLGNTIVGDLV